MSAAPSDRLATSIALFDRILSTLPASDLAAFEDAVVRRLPSLQADHQRADRAAAAHEHGTGCGCGGRHEHHEPEDLLDTVAAVVRQMVPPSGEAPGERTYVPRGPRFEGYTRANTASVDAFLYPGDDDVDELCEAGNLARCYCEDCGSRRTQPVNYVSHSASRDQLAFIFGERVLLGAHAPVPRLRGLTVVDVGSRLGAVLYGAFAFTDAARIVGVERNQFFAKLQRDVVTQRFPAMKHRVQVVEADVRDQAALLASADVVVMHNAFEWFGPADEQREIWSFMRNSVCKPGCLVVTAPSLHEALTPLGAAGSGKKKAALDHALPEIDAWVEELPIQYPPMEEGVSAEDDELRTIHLYRVKPQQQQQPAAAPAQQKKK